MGGDKGVDTFGFVEECRHLQVAPHVAQNHARSGGSAIRGRTTLHSGYVVSQKKRKRIEECFGWPKNDRAAAEGSTSRSLQSALDFYLRLRRLQSGAYAQPGRRNSGGVSRGRGASPARSS